MQSIATLDPKLHVSVDDNAELVTVTVPAGYKPPKPIIRQLHELAGNLGYGIDFRALAMTADFNADLALIRKAMTAALKSKPKDIAEYKRLAVQHRELLHAHSPEIKAQWERCVARA